MHRHLILLAAVAGLAIACSDRNYDNAGYSGTSATPSSGSFDSPTTGSASNAASGSRARGSGY